MARWVVHCQPVGSGAAALKYLAPYIFRVALSNSRITRLENDQVTFRFKASDTGQTKDCTLPAEQFISRFLQHVLPRGFMKVRYYGLFSPAQRRLLNQARSLLGVTDPPPRLNKPQLAEIPIPHRSRRCPTCGQLMRLQETIKPRSRQPP